MAWDDVLGQELAKRLFRAHLASGKTATAYLLAGPDGVGKRRLAVEMAKALNCTAAAGAKPCDACQTCGQIARGVHPDAHLLVPSGASDQIKIDDIRHLLGRINLRPFSAAVQVAILDGAERLTEEAANSLLKALEEPPSRTRFVLLTARLSFCLPTIVSRCQVVRCERLSTEAVAQVLLREQACTPEVAPSVARLSGGSIARAKELAERWDSHQEIVRRLADPSPLSWVERPLPETREEVARLLESMMAWLRDTAAERVRRQAQAADVDRCVETALELLSLRESVDQFVSPRLIAAMAREKWMGLRSSNA